MEENGFSIPNMQKTDAHLDMDEVATTERILDRMTNPDEIAKRERIKQEEKRIESTKRRIGV